MVRALDRKLLRDLRLLWSQALTLALVVASAVAGFITTYSAQDSLAWSRERYYAQARFADVFADLKRAPLSLLPRLAAIPGIAQLEPSVRLLAQIDLPGISDPITGRMTGIDIRSLPELNQLYLRSGQLPQVHRTGSIDVLVSEAFANARQLRPGDSLHALLNGKREALRISGIALSPEHIFTGLIGAPDLRGFGVFWLDQKALANASNMEGAFNHLAVRLAPGAIEAQVIDDLDRLLAPYGGTRAYGRSDQMSHKMLNAEIQEQRVLGTVLPSIFLAVAAFLLNVVLGRQISLQREQIAALKALGYPNTTIAAHYLKMVLLIVISGVILGTSIGDWLGHQLTLLYQQVFHFPVFHYRVRAELVLVALLLTITAGCAAAWQSLRDTVKLSPAQAMRPPSPGVYRPSFIEPLVRRFRLSPAMRIILRNMQRHRWRTALTVLGVAASMAVLISGTFWRDSISLMIETQFRHALRGDVSVYLIDPRPAVITQAFAHLRDVKAVEAARTVSVRLIHGQHDWRGNLTGKAAQPELHRIIDVEHITHAPPAQGLLITDRLADRLHIQPGQTIDVEIQEGQRQLSSVIVTGTVKEMMGMNAYMERHSLNQLLREGDHVNQLTLLVDAGKEASVLALLKQLPQVALAISKAVMLSNIQSITARNMLIISTVLTVFATVIAIGVVYNQTRIALTERSWELASLRVLGFTRAEVTTLLLGELAIAIAMAIPLGLSAGFLLASGIVSMTKTEEFYFALVIRAPTYTYAALCVVLAGVFSAFIVSRRIAQLDLVGVLKTRD